MKKKFQHCDQPKYASYIHDDDCFDYLARSYTNLSSNNSTKHTHDTQWIINTNNNYILMWMINSHRYSGAEKKIHNPTFNTRSCEGSGLSHLIYKQKYHITIGDNINIIVVLSACIYDIDPRRRTHAKRSPDQRLQTWKRKLAVPQIQCT